MDIGMTPEQVDVWVNHLLNEATDAMARYHERVTPESLHEFFEQQYNLPLSAEIADTWLRRQDWYHP